MNPIDRNKIWKMVGILALITVVAGGLLRVSQHSSYTLGDYAADNPSLAYQTAEPSPSPEPTPVIDNSNANATENLQEESSMAETAVLTGYSLNGELLTDQRTTLSDGFYYEPLSEKLQRYITGVSYPATVDNSDSSSETLLKSVEIILILLTIRMAAKRYLLQMLPHTQTEPLPSPTKLMKMICAISCLSSMASPGVDTGTPARITSTSRR